MEYMQYRAYYKNALSNKDEEICKFWIDENGEVDVDNLPPNRDVATLLQRLRLYEIHVEFTGRIEDD